MANLIIASLPAPILRLSTAEAIEREKLTFHFKIDKKPTASCMAASLSAGSSRFSGGCLVYFSAWLATNDFLLVSIRSSTRLKSIRAAGLLVKMFIMDSFTLETRCTTTALADVA